MTRPDIPVTISGNPRGFESALARVRAMARTSATDIAASFMRLRGLAGGAAGLAGALGLTAAVGAARDASRAIAEVGDAARRAGVDVRSFQELKFVAEQNRINVDALTDGLKELSLRADEFIVTGGGSAAEAFQRLGYSADELKKKLENPSALFTEIIGKLERMDKAAQIRILDEVFGGTGGEQFLQIIGQGEQAIRDQIKAANDLGIVMDEDLIRKAEDLDRRFNLISQTVRTALKSAIVSAADSLAEFIDGFRAFENQRTNTLQNKQAELGLRRLELENNMLAAQGNSSLSDRNRTRAIGQYKQQLADLAKEEAQVVAALSARPAPMDRTASREWTPPSRNINGGGSGRGRSGSAASADREAQAFERVIAALRDEIAVMGLSEKDRERVNALRQAGVTAASDEGKQILELIDIKQRQAEAEKQVQEARERGIEAAEQLGQTLDDQMLRIIDGTFDARDAVAALVQELINASTNGKGLFGSLFGAIAGGFSPQPAFSTNTTLGGFLGYGGARAGGGDVSPGRIYRINEYEDELFAPTNHGRIVAPSKLGNSGPAADGGRSVLEVRLGDGLVANILQQSADQSIELIRGNNQAQANYRQNGGEF